ncbi:MAG: M56 family metallopeptidase [Roseivirga sp.]|nr:M56 family metallopeptidase [Roseivirga sp.]
MPATIFIYALKGALVLSFLYLIYRLVFRQNTHYHLKRISLLAILIAAVVLPALEVQTEIEAAPTEPIANQIDTIMDMALPEQAPQEATVEPASTSDAEFSSVTWSEAIVYLYLAGLIVSLLIFFYQLSSVLYLIAAGDTRHDLGRKLITHRLIKHPFSFWKWTFIPEAFDISPDNWTIIHEHELAHLRQAHSIDLLLASLAKCFLWFTPASHYLQKSLRDNHEYLADQQVLKNHNIEEYSETLLTVCLQADSIQLTHSFALKSNLSKRINQMNIRKTSYLRSGIAACILLSFTILIATQVSLYGQDTQELEAKEATLKRAMLGPAGPGFSAADIYKQTGEFPDGWVYFRTKGFSPIVLLENQRAILEAFQKSSETSIEGQSERTYHIAFRKSKNLEFFDMGAHELKENKFRTELIQELSVKEKIEMYELAKAWSDKYIQKVYPDFELISELDFMEKNYLVFQSQLNPVNPRKYSVKTVFKSSEVDRLPEPVGGLDRYLKNVTKYAEKDPELDLADLPKKIEFEFTIDPGGNMVMVSLKTKVRGPETTQDRIYDLLRQVNDNLIKVSNVYGWQPGEKEGNTVATKMRLTIPKELL